MKSLIKNSKKVKNKKSAVTTVFKITGFLFLFLTLGIGIAEYIYRDAKETPLYKIHQYLTYSKQDWEKYEKNKHILKNFPVDSNMSDMVSEAPEIPIDTLIWESAIKNKDFIPNDVLSEIKRYKARDFSKLIASENKPTDEEAQKAIIQHYKNEVSVMLEEYNASIQIGAAYYAPLQSEDELVRVTAMVSAFNKERGNLGNIQMPLEVIYDFVKYKSEPNIWYISDFSQNIPYDYELNKERW